MSIFEMLFYLLGMVIVAMLAYAFTKFQSKPIKYVDMLRPRDGRGVRLKVTEESDLALNCDKKKGIVYRFIKIGRGWTFNTGGRMVTRFLGIEGTAYTGMWEGPVETKFSLKDYFSKILGKAFYDQIPQKQKKIIENDILGITVRIGEPDAASLDLPTLTSDDIFNESDAAMMRRFSKDMEKPESGMSLVNLAGAAVIGALLMYYLITSGLL